MKMHTYDLHILVPIVRSTDVRSAVEITFLVICFLLRKSYSSLSASSDTCILP